MFADQVSDEPREEWPADEDEDEGEHEDEDEDKGRDEDEDEYHKKHKILARKYKRAAWIYFIVLLVVIIAFWFLSKYCREEEDGIIVVFLVILIGLAFFSLWTLLYIGLFSWLGVYAEDSYIFACGVGSLV